jgi:hypothetical protein
MTPRGLPDFGSFNYDRAAASIDPAQLFLGATGCQSYYNTGRLIWLDTFHCGIGAWTLEKLGDARYPAISKTYCYIPGGALNIHAGTLTGICGGQIHRRIVYPNIDRIGIETMWLVGGARTLGYWVNLDYDRDGVGKYRAVLIYNTPTGGIYAGGYGPANLLGTLDTTSVSGLWLPIKLVIDVSTGMYVRAYVGNLTFDLSGRPLSIDVLDVPGVVHTEIDGYSLVLGDQDGYVGYVALTSDEP